jgi:hypothetical protein
MGRKYFKTAHRKLFKRKPSSQKEIKKIIVKSMEDVGIKGDRLTEVNKHKIESSFNTLLRKTGKTVFNKKMLKNHT